MANRGNGMCKKLKVGRCLVCVTQGEPAHPRGKWCRVRSGRQAGVDHAKPVG